MLCFGHLVICVDASILQSGHVSIGNTQEVMAVAIARAAGGVAVQAVQEMTADHGGETKG